MATIVVTLHLGATAYGNLAIPGNLVDTFEVSVGGTAEGSVVVINPNDAPLTVRVDVLDRIPGDRDIYVAGGTIDASAAAMVIPETYEFVLGPEEQRAVTYQVLVPSDATPAMSYWASLMFTPVTLNQPESGIRTRTRIAQSVIVHVDNPEPSRVVFGDVRRAERRGGADDGTTTLEATVQLDGARLHEVNSRTQVFRRDTGEEVFASTPRFNRLYPGFETTVAFPLGRLEAGPYEALLIVETGQGDVHAVRIDLDVGPTTP